MSEPNWLDARIGRHKVEAGESTPTEVKPRRKLWLKGARFALSDDEVNGRTVVELVLPEDVLTVLEDLTEGQLEGLATLPTFDTDPTPDTAALRGPSGELVGTAVEATDDTRSATLAATSTAVGVVGDGSVPTVLQADGDVALVRVGNMRLILVGSAELHLQRWVSEIGWQTRAAWSVSGGGSGILADGTLSLSGVAVELVVGLLTAALSNSSGTMLCSVDAPLNLRAAGAMTVQPAQSTSGPGHALTIGGGAGQTPGTDLAGKTIVNIGAPVANVTEEFEIRRSDNTKLLGVKQFASGFVWLDFGTSYGDIRSSSTVSLRGPTSVQYVTPVLQRFDPSGANYRDESSRFSPATINTATDTNVGSGLSISNVDSTEIIECTLGWWNKTDSTCGWRKFRRAFKRVGGTVSAVGSLIEDDAGSYVEAGETGVTCDFAISGVTVIPRITTPDTGPATGVAYIEQTKRLTW